MSLIRLTKWTAPTINPPTWKVFVWVDTMWPYSLDDTGTKTYLWVTQPTNIYGTEFHLFESNVKTNSTSKITKINWTTWILPVWKYKITISYNWFYEDKDTNFISYFKFWWVNVWEWSSDIIHSQRPRDKKTNQAYWFEKTFYVDVTTSWTKSVSLDFMPEDIINACMWNANIEIIRVS